MTSLGDNPEHHRAEIAILRDAIDELSGRFAPFRAGTAPRLNPFAVAIDHARTTLTAIDSLLAHRLFLHALVLARPMQELALQCLWASRESDGVERLLRGAFDAEAKHWDAQTAEASSLPQHAQAAILSARAALADMRDDAKLPADTKGMPNVRQLFERIHERDTAEELRQGGMSAAAAYVVGYGFPSAPTHANIVAIFQGQVDGGSAAGVRVVAAAAAKSLCRAITYRYKIGTGDLTERIDAVLRPR